MAHPDAVDEVAQLIRLVDGAHSLSSWSLAEALIDRLEGALFYRGRQWALVAALEHPDGTIEATLAPVRA